MPRFHGLDGQQIQYGNPGEYAIDDEKAFLISFEKQLRTADMANPEHITTLQLQMLYGIMKIIEVSLCSMVYLII